jgi:DNA-binding MarR family transcriptional regulator
MKRRPVEELEAGRAFYAQLAPDLDVSHFAAMWHLFNVGHLVSTDLDRVAGRYGLSIADLHLLGTLRIDRPARLRATDLAFTLHVSNAVLSARIARLERLGFVVRTPSGSDRRAFELTVTERGAEIAEAAVAEIARSSQFVQRLRRLTEADQAALARILGELHDLMDRDFIPTPRGDC